MKRLFEIDETEKRRILEMHETATKNFYLSEQGSQQQTCFNNSVTTEIRSDLSAPGTEQVLCETLKGRTDFYTGKYYFKSSGNGFIVYTPNATLIPSIYGTLKQTSNGYMFEDAMNRIEPPLENIVGHIRNMKLSPVEEYNRLKNFAATNRLQPRLFAEFMTSFLNNNQTAKTGLDNWKKEIQATGETFG